MNAIERQRSAFVPSPGRETGQQERSLTGRRKSSRILTPDGTDTARLHVVKRRPQQSPLAATTCTLDSLLEESQFRVGHEVLCAVDAVLGHVICIFTVQNTNFHAIVFSAAGPSCMRNLPIDQTKYRNVHSSQTRSPQHTQALATMLAIYLQAISDVTKLHLEATSSCRLPACDNHISTLLSCMKPNRSTSILPSLLQFLRPKYAKTIDVDFIMDDQSPLHEMLPRAVDLQDRQLELSKVPMSPESENHEKRDNLMHEILATERTYVSRLQHLLKDYAIPLRMASRKQRGILGTYETNALFPTSLDAILLLNEDFLKSLEAASGDFEFALTLANGFQDFRKIYARYLETSTDLDQVLRSAFKNQKFKEFTDAARANANANIGIRELVMEPISRIPRYSLLISSLLATITSENPSYQIFKEALLTVRRIGFMEKDEVETSREILMKLAALVSSWPAELVKSSLTVVTYVDCVDSLPIADCGKDSADGTSAGNYCSIVLCADRLVFLKRAKNYKLEEVLSMGKRGELGYRGFVPLEDVVLFGGEDCLEVLLRAEVSGVSSAKWISRPYRKLALMTSDATKFVRQFDNVRAKLRACTQTHCSETFSDSHIRYHVYNHDQWKHEREERKSLFRIWHDSDDYSAGAWNMTVMMHDPLAYSCTVRRDSHKEMLCREVASLAILKDTIHERLKYLHVHSWLDLSSMPRDTLVMVFRSFASSLLSAASSSSKSRPVSPSKLMTSFLGRKDNDLNATRPSTSGATPRTSTAISDRSSVMHHITKKKSNPLFNFGSDNKCVNGVETFVEALMTFEQFATEDLSPTNNVETKQATALMNSVSKDHKKGFAIRGSPSKVALHAFKLYCRTTLSKKLGGTSVISDQVCTDLRAHLKYEVDLKVTRMRLVLRSAPKLNLTLLKDILRFAVHLRDNTPEKGKIAALLLVSEMLVAPLSVTSFISTLEVLVDHFSAFFMLPPEDNLATTDSKGSGMTLPAMLSNLGSVSSLSHSYYTTDLGPLTSNSRSPAKLSDFSLSPDLLYDISSPDAAASLYRSVSGSSATGSLNSNPTLNYKRATIHVEKPFRDYGALAPRASSAQALVLREDKDKDLPEVPPRLTLPRSQSDQVTYTKSTMVMQQVRDPSPVRSILLAPQAPYSQSDLASTEGLRPSTRPLTEFDDGRSHTVQQRILPPSRIPIPSPRVTPTHSRNVSVTLPSESLSSKKESGVPRLPSLLVKRRESRQLSKALDDHTFQFDAELAADYRSMLQFSDGMTTDMQGEIEEPVPGNPTYTDSAENSPSSTPDRVAMRREIQSESKITSAATIRRVSKQLQKTQIGALDENSIIAAHDTSPFRRQIVAAPISRSGCTQGCREEIDMLRLELDHYKAIYRASIEEIDATLDLANEEIEELQSALETGSLEASVMKMLELEKEKNRKLRMQLAVFEEQHVTYSERKHVI